MRSDNLLLDRVICILNEVSHLINSNIQGKILYYNKTGKDSEAGKD